MLIILDFERPEALREADVPRKQRMCPVWEAGSTCRCSHAVAVFSLSTVLLDGHSHAACPLGPFKTLSGSVNGLNPGMEMLHVVSNRSTFSEL